MRALPMNDIFSPWTDRKQLRFILLTVIIYAGLLIPFKPFTIIPGFSEVRPANFVPALFGVLFGPAAAWGSAIGNLIADIASFVALGSNGTLSAGSIFGFIGNFLYAYVAWRVWNLMVEKDQKKIGLPQIGIFGLAALASGAICALIIGIGVFALGLQNFPQAMFLVMVITFNNFLPAATLGTLGLVLGYEKMKEVGGLVQERAKGEKKGE